MSFLDNDLAVATTAVINLGAKKPGAGKPIKLIAIGVTATVTVAHGATSSPATALAVVTCGGADIVEFELPSSTLQYVKFTFADGEVEFVLEGNQTNT